MLCGGMTHFKEWHCPFQKMKRGNCKIVSGPSETAQSLQGKGLHSGAAVSLLLGLLFIITKNNVKRNVTEHQKAISVISKFPNEYVVESCLFWYSCCQSSPQIKAPKDII